MERSVSQLLSVRREHNCTKLDVDELKHLWDITVAFIQVNVTPVCVNHEKHAVVAPI